MKRIFILLLLVASLCVGCSNEEKVTVEPDTTLEGQIVQLPRGLEGQWTSATVSDRGYSETITFAADGSLTVASMKNGKVEQSIYGTFYVDGNQIVFEITNGATPYKDIFEYTLDGRELYLIDDDGPAHYLRTS